MSDLRYRQIHLDFHTSEYIPSVAENFNGDDFAKTLKDSHIDSITCFARCHHGYLYYPSKAQPEMIHPSLAKKDLLLQQIEACHKYDIKVPIYTTVQWDGYVARKHPEWLAVDEEGKYINSQNVPEPHFYNTICLNSGYREYFKNHIQDIIDVVGVSNIDGFFMDILFKVDCNCPKCVEKMSKLGFDSKEKTDRIAYSLEMLHEFKTEITNFINERVPGTSIFYNSSHVGPALKDSLNEYTHLELESLPSGGWGYMHFPTTVRYARNLGKEILGMTGKFHTYWGDFHSLKNKAALEFECFQMLAMNAGCSIGDQLDPRGKLSGGAYDLIGHVYEQVEEKEPYCIGAKALTEIGVMTPEEYYTPKDHDLGLPPALVGAVRMLQELSYQFDIIDSTTDLSKYKIVILPDDIEYSSRLENILKEYIDKGGKVIGSYHSCIDTENGSGSLYGVSYKQESPYYRDFIYPNGIIGKELFEEEYVMYLRGAEIEARDSVILMDTIKPYFNREGKKFCSHQHTPSSGEKGYPAVTRKDNVIYFSHPIFKTYRQYSPIWCKMIIKDAIGLLLDEKYVEHDGPSTIVTTMNTQCEENRDILHVLHYIAEKRAENLYTIEDIIPLNNISFQVLVGDKEVAHLFNISNKQAIEYKRKGKYILFTADRIEGHEVFCIEYK
ncbi:hypothetical protein AN1V17_34890 [Vallitalea sediminicola]